MYRRLIAGAAAALLLTACVEDIGPASDACTAPSVEIELQLSTAAMDPTDPSVCRDQDVTLVVTSEVDTVFHIHGYDEQVPATEVQAGGETRIEFTASRSGQFPIELHALDDPAGVDVGVFTVHEP